MTAHEHDARNLSEAWDRLLTGDGANQMGAAPSHFETIRQLHQLDRSAVLRADLKAAIWTKALANARAELAIASNGHAPSLNGRTATMVVAAPRSPGALARTWETVAPRLVRFAWIVAAGLIGGFFAGITARLAMRLAGFLTVDHNRYFRTENGNRVGEITLGGALFLGVLAAGAGVVTMLLYVLLRDRLPWSGWRRSAVFSAGLFFVFGYVLMDPANFDYQLLGPTWLSVLTFSSLYLWMGLFTTQVYERGRTFSLRLSQTRGHLAVRTAVLAASFGLTFVGLAIGLAGVVFAERAHAIISLGLIAWLLNQFAFRSLWQRIQAPALVRSWGMLAIPGIIGLILTVQGVTEILIKK